MATTVKTKLKQFEDYHNAWLCVPREFYNWLCDYKKPSSEMSRQNDANFYLDMRNDGKKFLSKCFESGIYVAVETRYQHFNSGILKYAKP